MVEDEVDKKERRGGGGEEDGEEEDGGEIHEYLCSSIFSNTHSQ